MPRWKCGLWRVTCGESCRSERKREMVMGQGRERKASAPSSAGVAAHPSASSAARFSWRTISEAIRRETLLLAVVRDNPTRQWLQDRNQRNSLKTLAGVHFYPSITWQPFFCFPPMKSLLTFPVCAVECRFVCSPSCRPGKYQLFDNQMNQARTRLVCP